jgi:hypothetical protein
MSVHQIFREVTALAVSASVVLIHTLSKCLKNMAKIKVHFLFNFRLHLKEVKYRSQY